MPDHVIYTPTVDFVGTDSFTFRAYDGQDFSQTSTVTLTVAAVNDAPLALAQMITTHTPQQQHGHSPLRQRRRR